MIENVLDDHREALGFETLSLKEVQGQPYVTYQRPQGRRNRIKLNVSGDELVDAPTRLRLIPRYEDLNTQAELVAYSLVEVISEKLRCVIQRLQPRDLFDLHYLLVGQHVELDEAWELFERKARHRDLPPDEFGAKLMRNLPSYRSRWAHEMGGYVRNPAPFDQVERQLLRALRKYIK